MYEIVSTIGGLWALNYISYRLLNKRIREKQQWELNICCGHKDGGGTNADIVDRPEVNNFVLIEDVYNLPFSDGEFDNVLCAHTIEHVDDPERFWKELNRVGKNVTLVIPPIWDIAAAFNFVEHKTVFLSLRKEHTQLPRYMRYLPGLWYQRLFGQSIDSLTWVKLQKAFSRKN